MTRNAKWLWLELSHKSSWLRLSKPLARFNSSVQTPSSTSLTTALFSASQNKRLQFLLNGLSSQTCLLKLFSSMSSLCILLHLHALSRPFIRYTLIQQSPVTEAIMEKVWFKARVSTSVGHSPSHSLPSPW